MIREFFFGAGRYCYNESAAAPALFFGYERLFLWRHRCVTPLYGISLGPLKNQFVMVNSLAAALYRHACPGNFIQQC